VQRLPRRSVAVGVIIAAAMGLGAGAAHANNLNAAVTPYVRGMTQTVSGVVRARMRVEDTAADNRRVVGEFRRGSSAGALVTITATGGHGSSATSATGARIHEIRVGAVNDNPLHSNVWSGWSR